MNGNPSLPHTPSHPFILSMHDATRQEAWTASHVQAPHTAQATCVSHSEYVRQCRRESWSIRLAVTLMVAAVVLICLSAFIGADAFWSGAIVFLAGLFALKILPDLVGPDC